MFIGQTDMHVGIKKIVAAINGNFLLILAIKVFYKETVFYKSFFRTDAMVWREMSDIFSSVSITKVKHMLICSDVKHLHAFL